MIAARCAGSLPRTWAVRHAEILVAFQGIDETLLSPVHFRCSYGPADLRCDQRFQDMVCLDEKARHSHYRTKPNFTNGSQLYTINCPDRSTQNNAQKCAALGTCHAGQHA